MLKYFRIKLFYTLLTPFQNYSRKRRSKLFVKYMRPTDGMKVLDVGGQPEIWDNINVKLKITCLNLPGVATVSHETIHDISYVEGDGCDMPEFKEGQFDLVFSNSVIEHVGNKEKRKLFANEIRRISSRYWVQTPYKYYPIEPHCGMLFWWFYPNVLRRYLLNKWRKKLPGWTEMVENTTIVSTSEMGELFPESRIIKEWVIFPKSLISISN